MQPTSPLLFFVDVAAAVALLLWAVRLVRTGMERAFATAMKQWFRETERWRILAAATGMGAALLLQSSTAVALLTSSFLQAGSLAPAAGLAVLLGADLGSAVVVQLLVLRPELLSPMLLVAGVSIFLRGRKYRTRQIGRVLVGLALIFMSLDMLSDASHALPASSVGTALTYLGKDAVGAFFVGAALAWAMHSSVAAILLFSTLAATGALPLTGALAMALGANLGGGLVATGLTMNAATAVRRVVLANLLLRGGGAGVALWALAAGFLPTSLLSGGAAGTVVLVHLTFNATLLLLALPFTGLVMRGALAGLAARFEGAADKASAK